jgi:fucose permease
MSFLGAILPAWGYHLRADFSLIGHHFLALNAGLLTATWVARRLVRAKGIRVSLVAGCMTGFAAFLYLSLASPPVHAGWRIFGFFWIGVASGLVNGAMFHAISDLFRRNPAAVTNIAGAFFVLGCLFTTLLIASTLHVYTPAAICFFAALVPGFLGMAFARTRFAEQPPAPSLAWSEVAAQFSNPSALLFGLLLFFQFGNEWTIAGWLTIFLIHRLGVNPASALLVLALYWSSLLVGRVIAQWWLPRISHWKVLIGSGAGAMFGCLMLALTNNLFGASMGALLLGFSFAAIYPLVVEKIGRRFPSYHPGVFNGLFSFALAGGTLAPAQLGYLADWMGIGVVMLLPALGTFMVLLFSILIWVEARFGPSAEANGNRL